MNLSQIVNPQWQLALEQLPSHGKLTNLDYKMANLDWRMDLMSLRQKGLITLANNANLKFTPLILQIGGSQQNYYKYRLPNANITIYNGSKLMPDDIIDLYRSQTSQYVDLILIIDNHQPMLSLMYLALILLYPNGTAVWRVNRTWKLNHYFNFLRTVFQKVDLICLECDYGNNDLYLIGTGRLDDITTLEAIYQLQKWNEFGQKYSNSIDIPAEIGPWSAATINDVIAQWWL